MEIEVTKYQCKECNEELGSEVSCSVHSLEKRHSVFNIIGTEFNTIIKGDEKAFANLDVLRNSKLAMFMRQDRMT